MLHRTNAFSEAFPDVCVAAGHAERVDKRDESPLFVHFDCYMRREQDVSSFSSSGGTKAIVSKMNTNQSGIMVV